MKRLIKIIGVLAAAATASMIIACAKSTGNDTAVTPMGPIPPVVGTGPLGMATGSQYRFYAQNQQWATAWNTYYLYNYGIRQNSTSSLTLNSSFKTVLKDAMGVCDLATGTSTGIYDCNTWMSSGFHDIGVEFTGTSGNMANVIIRSFPNQSASGFSFNLSLPSWEDFFGIGSYTAQATYNPMKIQMSAWPINDSQGFQLTSYGPNWSKAWNAKLMVVVNSGKLEDATIPFTLQYQADGATSPTTVGTGTLNRCQSQSCGF